MKRPFFSIIVVCLNPGEKLTLTLDSIAMQACADYEVIVKDGLSEPGQINGLHNYKNMTLVSQADRGIYEAMNQAAAKAGGRYVYFLNCGDVLYDEQTLALVKEKIENSGVDGIFYGNILEETTSQIVAANPRLTRFACYRHPPCHQACFYRRKLLLGHPFVEKYRVRADYEHFLWCVLAKRARTVFMPLTIARYEGAGYSEAKENKQASAREFREIVRLYMPRGEVFLYRFIMTVTLAPLRTALARNRKTAGVYNRLKEAVYIRKRDAQA
ncbi:MAG: glycosyltransferase [Lachnospiraceae bacterium]|nr:glycosyltransferase [Lachnospiraceae bacterium]